MIEIYIYAHKYVNKLYTYKDIKAKGKNKNKCDWNAG